MAAEVTKNEAFRATNSRNGLVKLTKFPVFFPVSREFTGGEGFARDCILRHAVSTAEKPSGRSLKGRENPRNSANFALKPDSEKCPARPRNKVRGRSSLEGRCAVRFEEFHQANAMRSQTDQ